MKETLTPGDLTYSATTRCVCGAGVAFVNSVDGREGQRCFALFKWWNCGDVWLGLAEEVDHETGEFIPHDRRMYFYMFDIELEKRGDKGEYLRSTRPGVN